MSWVEVDGAGWSQVEVGARFSNTRKNRYENGLGTVVLSEQLYCKVYE